VALLTVLPAAWVTEPTDGAAHAGPATVHASTRAMRRVGLIRNVIGGFTSVLPGEWGA